MPKRYYLETLGCPKNQVDSDKLAGQLAAQGYQEAAEPGDADVVVVNTCAFIDAAREESVETILAMSDNRRAGARLVVTGCMAERYEAELQDAIPEVDLVAPFGHDLLAEPRPLQLVEPGAGPSTAQAVSIGPRPRVPDFDLLNLPRPRASRPWAYVKIAEGCDRACGFCAIPSFRGPQRSRSIPTVLDEVESLDAREIVLVAQDLANYGRDHGRKSIVELIQAVSDRVEWVRALYLYPSELTDELVDAICGTGVPYFDLSLQHVSPPLLRRMRRWGDGARFLERIETIRAREPAAAFRSNFIVGYPGETEDDHDELLGFVEQAELDWCGFFPFSLEEGTYAAGLDQQVDPALAADRLAELSELQDAITARRRNDLVGTSVVALVDTPGQARSHREAPEIDGIIAVPDDLPVGQFIEVRITGAEGPDLEAVAV